MDDVFSSFWEGTCDHTPRPPTFRARHSHCTVQSLGQSFFPTSFTTSIHPATISFLSLCHAISRFFITNQYIAYFSLLVVGSVLALCKPCQEVGRSPQEGLLQPFGLGYRSRSAQIVPGLGPESERSKKLAKCNPCKL